MLNLSESIGLPDNSGSEKYTTAHLVPCIVTMSSTTICSDICWCLKEARCWIFITGLSRGNNDCLCPSSCQMSALWGFACLTHVTLIFKSSVTSPPGHLFRREVGREVFSTTRPLPLCLNEDPLCGTIKAPWMIKLVMPRASTRPHWSKQIEQILPLYSSCLHCVTFERWHFINFNMSLLFWSVKDQYSGCIVIRPCWLLDSNSEFDIHGSPQSSPVEE